MKNEIKKIRKKNIQLARLIRNYFFNFYYHWLLLSLKYIIIQLKLHKIAQLKQNFKIFLFSCLFTIVLLQLSKKSSSFNAQTFSISSSSFVFFLPYFYFPNSFEKQEKKKKKILRGDFLLLLWLKFLLLGVIFLLGFGAAVADENKLDLMRAFSALYLESSAYRSNRLS